MGHSSGKTMSYGYYAKEHEVKELKEVFIQIEKFILDRCWGLDF
jgi:hypothetical protein